MNYTSVSRYELQKAFALAHKASEDETVPISERIRFRAIARLIWKAHGEPGEPIPGSGLELLTKIQSAAKIAALPNPLTPSVQHGPTQEGTV